MGAGDNLSRLNESERKIKGILEDAKSQVKLERREQVFEGNKKLSSEDLKTPQDPEEFTKGYIIEKVFQILKVSYKAAFIEI